jgi:hypothetical protein
MGATHIHGDNFDYRREYLQVISQKTCARKKRQSQTNSRGYFGVKSIRIGALRFL